MFYDELQLVTHLILYPSVPNVSWELSSGHEKSKTKLTASIQKEEEEKKIKPYKMHHGIPV